MYIQWPFLLAFELLKLRSYWRRFVLPHRNLFSSFQQVRQLAVVSSTDFAEKKRKFSIFMWSLSCMKTLLNRLWYLLKCRKHRIVVTITSWPFSSAGNRITSSFKYRSKWVVRYNKQHLELCPRSNASLCIWGRIILKTARYILISFFGRLARVE